MLRSHAARWSIKKLDTSAAIATTARFLFCWTVVMSLFGSIQLANNALLAMQLGIQVTGNNIANANTPGYIRQNVVLTPAATQRKGDLLLGLGVQVSAIIQQTDKFLDERLRAAVSDLANGETQEQAFTQLETILGELGDTDL